MSHERTARRLAALQERYPDTGPTVDDLRDEADDWGIRADRSRLAEALLEGGYARVTVRSLKTGQHVSLTFSAKVRNPSGDGYVPRNQRAGRVALGEADVVFVDAQRRAIEIARFSPATGEWQRRREASDAEWWTAQKLLAWVHGNYDLDARAEIFMATECYACGRSLDDPESIELGIGPECRGQRTRSRHA